VCVNIHNITKKICVCLLVFVTDFFFFYIFIEREEPMELVKEQEEMEGRMQCDVLSINILN